MSIIEILILFLVIIVVIGAGWILLAFIFMIYGWIETKLIKRKIDDKIKKEVEDGRLKRQERREEFGRGYRESNIRESESTSSNKSLSRDAEVRGRTNIQIQPTGDTPRSKPSSKIEWADFS